MRRIASAAAAVALGVLAGTSTGRAQRPYESGSTRPISIGFGGGVSVPVSDYKESFKNGFNGQGFIRFNLPGVPIAPRIDVTFQRLDWREGQFEVGDPRRFITGGNSQILGGLANLTYGLGAGPIRPYILAGLGAYNVKTELESGSSTPSDSRTKFGINGGAGITFRLGAISAYVEGRIDNIYTSEDQDVGANLKSVKVIPVTFGVVF